MTSARDVTSVLIVALLGQLEELLRVRVEVCHDVILVVARQLRGGLGIESLVGCSAQPRLLEGGLLVAVDAADLLHNVR